MKIAFLCGSLEPGKDGVGDYTRLLSQEMTRKNHLVLMISINDRYLEDLRKGEEAFDQWRIPCLRISSSFPSRKKFKIIEKEITDFAPDWISLQFVPYAFQKKGLPWDLSLRLKALGNWKWHIMFHELWIGIDKNASLKHRLIGKVQEGIVKVMVNTLRPSAIHTQSSVYKEVLEEKGIKATLLPLFSNIPKHRSKVKKSANDKISFVVFGSIQPLAPFSQFLEELVHFQEREKKKLQFIFVGRSGGELSNWISLCEEKKVEVLVLGEQDPARISDVFYKADWGISSTPFYQSEKSGSIAAMLDHELPVYCVAREWVPRSLKKLEIPISIRKYEQHHLNLENAPMGKFENDIVSVTNLFSSYLSEN